MCIELESHVCDGVLVIWAQDVSNSQNTSGTQSAEFGEKAH
jgi:hypothetical protein